MYYPEEQKLGYVEFCTFFAENLSHLITNEAHITENESFYEEVIFKLFELYLKMDNCSINSLIRIFEVFLYSMFKHTPGTILPEDKITII